LIGATSGILLDVYSQYTSSTSYTKLSSTGTVTQNTVNTVTGPLPLSSLYLYPSYVYQYLASSAASASNYNPLRIRFQLSSTSTGSLFATDGDYIEIDAPSGSFNLLAGRSVFCYYKQFINPSTKYKTQYTVFYPQTTCTLNSSTIIVRVPSTNLQLNSLYELVVTSKYTTNMAIYYSTSVGLQSFTSSITLKIKFYYTTSIEFYSEDRLWTYKGGNYNQYLQLSNFYVASKGQGDTSIFYLKFYLKTGSGATFYNFPQSFIEIQFPTEYTMFPNQIASVSSTGSENLCYSSLITIGTTYQPPRCIVVYGDSSNNLPSIMRIENYKSFSLGTYISLSTEEITMASSSSPPINLKLVIYSYPTGTYNLPNRYFVNLYDLFSVGASMTLNSQAGNFATFTNFYWLSTTGNFAGGPTSWFPGNAINDKIVVKFPSSIASNAIFNFGTLTITMNGGGALTALYRNTRNYYILLYFTAANANASPTLKFSSVSLPTIGSFTLPQTFICDVYKNYEKNTELTLTLASGSISTQTTTSGTGFPSSFTDYFTSNFYNSGTNRFLLSLSSLSFVTGINMLQISVSSGQMLQCFFSSYLCHVSDGMISIRPINPTA